MAENKIYIVLKTILSENKLPKSKIIKRYKTLKEAIKYLENKVSKKDVLVPMSDYVFIKDKDVYIVYQILSVKLFESYNYSIKELTIPIQNINENTIKNPNSIYCPYCGALVIEDKSTLTHVVLYNDICCPVCGKIVISANTYYDF